MLKRAPYLLYFFIAFITIMVMRPAFFSYVLQGELINPDSYMRLVRIQEAFDHHEWFTSVVSRNESGAGTLIYWSHLVDAFILALSLPLKFLLGCQKALFWAAALYGPVCVGLLGAFSAWAIKPLVSRAWLWIVPLGIALSPSIINYGHIGIATHHLTILLFTVIAWGFVGRAYLQECPFYAWGAGIASGLAIWVSPEAAPFCLMGFGTFVIASICQPSNALVRSMKFYGAGFLGLITVALFLDPPYQGMLSVQLDRISCTFLILAALICAYAFIPYVLWRLQTPLGKRVVWMCSGALFAMTIWLCLFPAYLHGLSGLMTPEQAKEFFITTEMAPIANFIDLMTYGFAGIASVAVLCVLSFRQKNSPYPYLLWYVSICASLCTLLALMHIRFAMYSSAISIMTMACVLSLFTRTPTQKWDQAIRLLALISFLILPNLVGDVDAAFGLGVQSSAERREKDVQRSCRLEDARMLLYSIPGRTVLADVNIGPALLYKTDINIVGAFYHAGIKGYMKQKAAWGASDSVAKPSEIVASGADYILICPEPPMRKNHLSEKEQTHTTLLERLNTGEVPSWLSAVPHSARTDWVLYQIR